MAYAITASFLSFENAGLCLSIWGFSDKWTHADDMKGFSGDPGLGVVLNNVYVKGKLDVLQVGFNSGNDKNAFVKHVQSRLQELEAARVRLELSLRQ
jgi:hypothetical protein